jgi:hypothetical protein
MLKNIVGSLVLVLGVASYVCSCGSGGTAGGTGGPAGADAAICVAPATPITTLAEACARNCCLASGLTGCSTTEAVCEQSCMTTFDNTSAINPDLGVQYTKMMVCVANDPYFATSAGFTCAKPDRALTKWSPLVDADLDTPCKQEACDWNCNDATLGNFDPWMCIPCHCSSVH